MGTISDKLQYLSETKEAIKNKLSSLGIDTSIGDTFRDYVDKIDEYFTSQAYANAMMPLPNTRKTINGNSMYVSPNIKIYARTIGTNEYNSYSVEEWGELKNNYTDIKTVLEPVGIDINTDWDHFVIFFYLENIDDYYPVHVCENTGGTSKARLNAQGFNYYNTGTKYYGFRHSLYYWLPVNSTTYNGQTARLQNPDNTTATITRDKNNFILGSPNTHYTWTIRENCGFRIALTEPEKDILRAEAIYAQNEWMRHRASIIAKNSNGNDITTDLPDTSTYKPGTDEPDLYKVDIVTQNDEMYFNIIVDENDRSKDILTNNLAKYNSHSFLNNYNPTMAANTVNGVNIIDQIYNDQKRMGVNINSGLNPNDLIKILTPGAKGAEAYVFNGKWRIITPILSYCNTLQYHVDRNMIDSPTIYYWKNVIRPRFNALGINNIQLLNEKWVQLFAVNRASPSANYTNTYTATISNLLSFLRANAGGKYGYDVVPNMTGLWHQTWTSTHLTETAAVGSTMSYSSIILPGVQSRLIPFFGVDLEPLAPPVITYDENNDLVTITAEEGTEIYYTISNSSTPDIEPTLIEIMKGNTKIKKYTGPFKSNVQFHFTIRAIAVKYKQKCSVESCEYFDVYISEAD